MRHTSTALYFYESYLKSLHKPRATSEIMLFHISYGFNYYLQLLCLQFLSKTRLNFNKFSFVIKIALFPNSLLYQSMTDELYIFKIKLSHINKTDIIYFVHKSVQLLFQIYSSHTYCMDPQKYGAVASFPCTIRS